MSKPHSDKSGEEIELEGIHELLCYMHLRLGEMLDELKKLTGRAGGTAGGAGTKGEG
jgi:hypothetical protein